MQETHLGSIDIITLTSYFRNHIIFHNNHSLGRAGTVIMVSRDYATGYDIQVVDLGEAAKGRVQAIHLTSLLFPHRPTASFNVVNVYLTAGDKHAQRCKELATLAVLDRSGHTFMCGDFNMTDKPEDSPSHTSYLTLRGKALEAWEKFLDTLGLKEVPQDTHTHFFLTTPVQGCRTSRIDRVYTTLSDTDLLVVTPTCFIPVVSGRDPRTEYSRLLARDGLKTRAFKANFISDHIPVGLAFSSNVPGKKRGFNIPKWMGDTEGFAEKVWELWDQTGGAYECREAWKTAVAGAAKAYFEKGQQKIFGVQDSLTFLTRAIAVIRACAARKQDKDRIRAMLARYEDIKSIVTLEEGGDFQTMELERQVEVLFSSEMGDVGLSRDAEDPLPPLYLPGDGMAEDPIKAVKARLPNTRARLTHLKAVEGDILTCEPQAMGDIITTHYTGVWAYNHEGATDLEIWDYLGDYDVRVPKGLQPRRPSPDDFIEAINESNDSAAGPDGIPFSIYRACLKHNSKIAHVLCDVSLLMADGVKPPRGYNHARLFLIPKKTGGLVADTRCIAVTNGDNRLNATVVTKLITPALQEIIHPDQRGFVAGREGTAHVHALTEGFYAGLSKKQQRYVLLLDTARAFDTLAHNFIHLCLKRMGWAVWFCTMIDALLSDVLVIPVLAAATTHRIRIQRGVKQGCPLSPLLFIMCFNVLLCYLSNIKGLKKFGFADDLALLARAVTVLVRALLMVRLFSYMSDLHPNQKKTCAVSVFPPSRRTKERFAAAGWGAMQYVRSGVYLGVMFGPEVTSVQVCQGALDKFMDRATSFHHIIRSSSIHTRILIFNTFLLPLFYYLAQFIILPYPQLVVPVREVCRRWVIPFGGGGFGYVHIITPRGGGFALARPLKDLWALNMAFLAAHFGMEASHQSPTPVLGEYTRVAVYKGLDRTLRTDDHRAYCAFAFMEDYAPRGHGQLLDLAKLPPKSRAAARRKWIYDHLVGNGYKGAREYRSFSTSIQVKLGKALKSPPSVVMAGHLVAHAKLASALLSPARWNVQVRLTFNALPFDERRAQAQMEVKDRTVGGRGSPFPCWICGDETDSMTHVMGDCVVVNRAKTKFGLAIGCALQPGLEAALLAFRPTSNQLATLATCAFNYAVWHLRTHFFCTLSAPPGVEQSVDRIVEHAVWGLPTDNNKEGEMRTRQLACLPPPEHLACFTDGSALGNPGPCGGGFRHLPRGEINRRKVDTTWLGGQQHRGDGGPSVPLPAIAGHA